MTARDTQRVVGAVQIVGPQAQSKFIAATISSALSLASIDAKIAACDTNNVRLAAGTKVGIENDPFNPVLVRGVMALDPSEVLPLPVNAAKEAGGNLEALLGRTPALGGAAMAAASPVVMAFDQPPLAFNPSAAAEDGHLCALRDIAQSQLRATLAAFQLQAVMAGAFVPIQEV